MFSDNVVYDKPLDQSSVRVIYGGGAYWWIANGNGLQQCTGVPCTSCHSQREFSGLSLSLSYALQPRPFMRPRALHKVAICVLELWSYCLDCLVSLIHMICKPINYFAGKKSIAMNSTVMNRLNVWS